MYHLEGVLKHRLLGIPCPRVSDSVGLRGSFTVHVSTSNKFSTDAVAAVAGTTL